MLLVEIAIAARSTAHRLGAVWMRSLVKVRSSPNAESRLFARRVYGDQYKCVLRHLQQAYFPPIDIGAW